MYSFTLIIIISFNSCSGVLDSFGTMFKVKDSIEKVYPDVNVGVNITNWTFITVSLINSDLNNKSEEDKKEAVEKISKIVKYFYRKKKMRGRLNFVKQQNYIIYRQSQSYGFDLDLSDEKD